MFLELAGKRQNRLIQSISHAMKLLNLMRKLLFVLPHSSRRSLRPATRHGPNRVPQPLYRRPLRRLGRASLRISHCGPPRPTRTKQCPSARILCLATLTPFPNCGLRCGTNFGHHPGPCGGASGTPVAVPRCASIPDAGRKRLFAQYTAAGISPFDGTSVEQNVVLCLEVDGSQVVRIVEFANPAIVLANRESMSLLGSR